MPVWLPLKSEVMPITSPSKTSCDSLDSCSTLTAKTLDAETAGQIQSVTAITTTTMKQVLLTGVDSFLFAWAWGAARARAGFSIVVFICAQVGA